jgi:hypothetical protein
MLCAVYSSPQETSKHIILWSDTENKNWKKGASNDMATKKGGKKAAKKAGGTKKGGAKKGGTKKAAKKR